MTKPRSGNLSIIPAAAVFDRRLSHADVRVLAALGAHADKNGRCWPATTTLANETGMSERHARTSLRNLETIGYIETESRPGQSSMYRIPRNYTAGVSRNQAAGVEPEPRNQAAGTPEPYFRLTILRTISRTESPKIIIRVSRFPTSNSMPFGGPTLHEGVIQIPKSRRA